MQDAVMIIKRISRFYHTSKSFWAVEKSHLSFLRKKTGYTFANCKKALELHDNDTGKAEVWLREQATSLGWSKATKLVGRQTMQGLIGVALNKSAAVLIEINCETDFVARNNIFQDVVVEAANACLQFTQNHAGGHGPLTKIGLDLEQLQNLRTLSGNKLSDSIAQLIGNVGENATLRRAVCWKGNSGTHLYGYAHPSGTSIKNVLLGRLGGIVALRQTIPKASDIDDVGKSICQHIVGMNPKKIGVSSSDKPAKNADDEVCLIYQEFLEDPDVTVNDILVENGIEIVDFKRFECGEGGNESGKPLELVETCQ